MPVLRPVVPLVTVPLVIIGCASHAPPAAPVQPAFDAAVECVVQTMRSGMFLETRRSWVLRNSELRGGGLERDPSQPELGRDHLELRFASGTTNENALVRIFGTEPGTRVEVNVGPAEFNTKRDQLLREARGCAASDPS